MMAVGILVQIGARRTHPHVRASCETRTRFYRLMPSMSAMDSKMVAGGGWCEQKGAERGRRGEPRTRGGREEDEASMQGGRGKVKSDRAGQWLYPYH